MSHHLSKSIRNEAMDLLTSCGSHILSPLQDLNLVHTRPESTATGISRCCWVRAVCRRWFLRVAKLVISPSMIISSWEGRRRCLKGLKALIDVCYHTPKPIIRPCLVQTIQCWAPVTLSHLTQGLVCSQGWACSDDRWGPPQVKTRLHLLMGRFGGKCSPCSFDNCVLHWWEFRVCNPRESRGETLTCF